MAKKTEVAMAGQSFEGLKSVNEHAAEYWSARDLPAAMLPSPVSGRGAGGEGEGEPPPTLEEKLAHQKRQRDLEGARGKLRRDLFARQDEVEAQRNDLITQLEVQLQQQVEARALFAVQWQLV